MSVLYSTNPFLKFYVQQKYCGDVHYVWCSEYFDGAALGRYGPGIPAPPSSDPAEIYRALKLDISRRDGHSAKIEQLRAGIVQRAIDWEAAGALTTDQKEEILYFANDNDFSYWRPLLYVIPRLPLAAGRIKLVPPGRRAGMAPEYIIEDLQRVEFDIIEP